MDFVLKAAGRSANTDESYPLHSLAAKARLSEMEMKGAKEDSFKMIKLIGNQRFDGFWQLNKSLSEILGLSLNKIKSASVVKDVNFWATAHAVAFLRKDWKEQKEEWEMIEEKALTWLRSKDLESRDVIKDAMAFLTA